MKKLNNKGFSLVELIIVIAIMAILVGVVGAQVIPYLETSREGKDLQIISGWNTSGMSAYSSAAAQVDGSAVYTITVTIGGSAATCSAVSSSGSAVTAGCTEIAKYFDELTAKKYDASQFESKKGKTITTVTITINGATGTIETKASDGTNQIFSTVETK